MELEHRRQTAQIFLGLLVITSLIFIGRTNTLLVVGAVLLVGISLQFYVVKRGAPKYIKFLLDVFERDGYKDKFPGKGAMTYALGTFFTVFLFPYTIILQCVLVMSVSDSLSTLFGKKYGKKKLINGKTLVGSGVFLISALLIEMLFHNILVALVVALVATVAEILPLDDNVTVPLSVGFTLGGLPYL